MIPVIFGTAYTALLLAISYLLIERLIHKAQTNPILVQVAEPVQIAGNGHGLTEIIAALTFATVEGAARVATAKGKL